MSRERVENTCFPAINQYFQPGDLKRRSEYFFEVRKNSREIWKKFDVKRRVLVITGAPGGGKDALTEELMRQNPGVFGRPKTVTTRLRRESEENNDPYIRMTKEEFVLAWENDMFIETNVHNENFYGCPKSEVIRVLNEGLAPILRIDPNGAIAMQQIWAADCEPFRNCILTSVHIIPPAAYELYKRLFRRTESDLKKKLKVETLNKKDQLEVRREVQDRMPVLLLDLDKISQVNFVLVNPEGKLKQIASEFMNNFPY